MVMDGRIGSMFTFTKAILNMIKWMAKVDSFRQTATVMRVIGLVIKNRVMDNTIGLLVKSTWENFIKTR